MKSDITSAQDTPTPVVWNGNNTAIDGCADGTEGSCSTPGIPSRGGTIMSYCDRKSVGVNFALGFGYQPRNVIRNMIDNANCLGGTCLEICPGNVDLSLTSQVNKRGF